MAATAIVLLLMMMLSYGSTVAFDCHLWRLDLDGLGNTLFFAGDRRFVVPSIMSDLESNYCKQQFKNLDELRTISRNCLPPFAKQMTGLLTYGFRKNIRRTCSNHSLKKEILQKFNCFRNDTIRRQLDSTVAPLIIELEFIRDQVHNSSEIMLRTCCAFDTHSRVCLLTQSISFFSFCLHTEAGVVVPSIV